MLTGTACWRHPLKLTIPRSTELIDTDFFNLQHEQIYLDVVRVTFRFHLCSCYLCCFVYLNISVLTGFSSDASVDGWRFFSVILRLAQTTLCWLSVCALYLSFVRPPWLTSMSIILVGIMVTSGRQASRKLGVMNSDTVPMPNVAQWVEVTLRVSIAALRKPQLCRYLLAKIG